MLPPSMYEGDDNGGQYEPSDSEMMQALRDAVTEYVTENGLPESDEARGWLQHPTYGDVIQVWETGGGFSTEQWLQGMHDLTGIRIVDNGEGGIYIEFEAEFDIGDYELGSRTPAASF